MTDALKFEVKKDGWGQLQNGSYKLALTLNPTDLDDNGQELLLQFVKAPMGTRYALGMAEIGDDEQAVEPPTVPVQGDPGKPASVHFKDKPRSQQAALACKDMEFQTWLCRKENYVPREDNTITAIYQRLGISSRTQLDIEGAPQAPVWDKLYAQFQADTGRVAEQR